MTKKEMENAMSFIVEQQAQFAVNQEQSKSASVVWRPQL